MYARTHSYSHIGTFIGQTAVSPTTDVAASGTQPSYQNKTVIFGNMNNGRHHNKLQGQAFK
jgi:hypothetical protein